MKTFCAVIGFIHLTLSAIGILGGIDYHLCIKPVGQCSTQVVKSNIDATKK
jgi:hypothetical protein